MTFQWAQTQIDSAHRDADGCLHGHTWTVRAWRAVDPDNTPDVIDWLERVEVATLAFDHRILETDEQWAEQLAARIGERTGARKVKVWRRLLADLRASKRQHKQSTWGPEDAPTPEPNLCNTPMCTAGHLVSMGGEKGWALKEEYGWATAAALIHYKAHPDQPVQNFGAIPDAWAMAYIEEMAALEANGPPPGDSRE